MADVFVSYSREDQAVARRFATALESAGFSVWWDQSLSPGETFDQVTEQSLREAKAVVVLWSARSVNSRWVRSEATQADRLGKLVPITIEPCERPILFELSHTVDLTGWKGDTKTPAWLAVVDHVAKLAGSEQPARAQATPVPGAGVARTRIAIVAAAIFAAVVAGWFLRHEIAGKPGSAATAGTAQGSEPAAFAPPPNSVAVMPFANLSGDPDYAYFTDGISEELLNSLARVSGLQVSARTSSFSFKDGTTDVPTIGRKLNVAAVLEGSVRREGKLVRITAQLINSVNGYHLWSQNFDRKATSILALQTEVADAVAQALKVKLLPADTARITAGGTGNDAAYEAYLRGRELIRSGAGEESYKAGLAVLEESLRLDPDFAWAQLYYGVQLRSFAESWISDAAQMKTMTEQAREHIERARKLAPDIADVYTALSGLSLGDGDLAAANAAVERALDLEPGNFAALLSFTNINSMNLARQQDALDAATRALSLDPLSHSAWRSHGIVLYKMGRYTEAAASLQHALSLRPGHRMNMYYLALDQLALGNAGQAATLCETVRGWEGGYCLAIAQGKLGRDAQARETFEKLRKEFGDDLAYQYAAVHAQWGDVPGALKWLSTAERVKDPGLAQMATDPLMVPLRDTPLYREVAARETPSW